eukprot:symbB.v1.2.000397.t1/scaffold30.1/size407774/13
MVRHGAMVRARITAAVRDETKPLEQRALYGPKEHTWIAGSGVRCQLIELMVTSMQSGETCVSSSKDSSLYEDSDLGVAKQALEVEYAISVLEVDDIGTQSSQTVLRRATEQKAVAAEVLKQGQVHLALQKYLVLCNELDALEEGKA